MKKCVREKNMYHINTRKPSTKHEIREAINALHLKTAPKKPEKYPSLPSSCFRNIVSAHAHFFPSNNSPPVPMTR